MRLFAALVSLAAVAPSQEPTAIRVDVNLVNVAFAVRDAHGALAAGLTQDDFQVFEDGVPQKISFFARSADVPLTLGLIVDASGSQEHFVREHQHHLEKFFQDVLAPRDRAFLACFGNHQRLVSDLHPRALRSWRVSNASIKATAGFRRAPVLPSLYRAQARPFHRAQQVWNARDGAHRPRDRGRRFRRRAG